MKKLALITYRMAVNEFLWERCFDSIGVNEKVNIFNKTVKNIYYLLIFLTKQLRVTTEIPHGK